MKFLRRVASAVVLGVIFASGIRLGGGTAVPTQHGGWRPLELPPIEGADARAN
ncbi:MAG: hypothetical protein AAGG08_01445 [Actinomycetota bacterium]